MACVHELRGAVVGRCDAPDFEETEALVRVCVVEEVDLGWEEEVRVYGMVAECCFDCLERIGVLVLIR